MDATREYDELCRLGERVKPLVVDVTELLRDLHAAGRSVLFEGAQGAMLDIDLGTYPFVTSSNTTVGGAATGTGVGPKSVDHVLGIVKAYTTRVGAGPFPTELLDDMGRHLAKVGAEFGSTTGRPRRCGWFDAVLLKRAAFTNSLDGLCVTKLDVLDGLPEIKICVGYRLAGQLLSTPPLLDRPLRGVRARLRDDARLVERRPRGRRRMTRCPTRRRTICAASRSLPACRSTSSRPVRAGTRSSS